MVLRQAPSTFSRFACISGLLALLLPAQVSAQAPSSPPAADITTAFSTLAQRVEYTAGNQTYPVEWTYTNHWNIPLVIERIETSCACLTPQAESLQVAPGATGEIHSSLIPGSYRGLFRKSHHVKFVGFEKSVELTAEVTIPSPVMVSKQELTWTVKDHSSSATQIIDVTTGTNAAFKIKELLGVSEAQFRVEKKTIVPEKHYQLHITPAKQVPTSPSSTALQIHTDSPDPRDQVLVIFLTHSN